MNGADYGVGWMPRCILLTPNRQRAAWVEAIGTACREAGFDFVFVQDRSQHPVDGEDRRVIMACDPAFLAPSNDADVTVIVADVSTALGDTEALTGASSYDGVVDTSQLLLNAIEYPCTKRLFVDRDREPEVEVLPGVFAKRPMIGVGEGGDPLAVAASEAFKIYAPGTIDRGARAVLTPALFEYDERQDVDRTKPVLQTMGGPRWLLRGPGLATPAGDWEVSATFSVNEDAAKHRYVFDYGDREDLQRLDFIPKQSGVYRIVAALSLASAARVDLRLILSEGSIEGCFEFLGAELRRL